MLLTTVTGSSFNFQTSHALTHTFNTDVHTTVSLDDFFLNNLTTNSVVASGSLSQGFNGAGTISTITFPGLTGTGNLSGIVPDGNWETIIEQEGVAGLAAAYVYSFYFLNGDVNGSRSVGGDDFNIFAQYNGTQSGATFSQCDLNYDGAVTNADYNILATNFGKQMPAPLTGSNTLSTNATSNREVNLTWTAPANGTPDGYRIWRSLDGVTYTFLNFVEGAGTLNYPDGTLTDGVKRWYRVRPYTTASGNGATTNESSSVTVMNAPSVLSVTAVSTGGTNLSWVNNSSSATGFRIERSLLPKTGYSEVTTTTTTATTYHDATALENTTYYYRVSAVNGGSGAVSAPSAKVGATTAAVNAPNNARARTVSGGAVLWWQDNSSAETGFQINWQPVPGTSGSAGSLNVTPNRAYARISNLTSEYLLSIRALGAGGVQSTATPTTRPSGPALDSNFDNPPTGYATAAWSPAQTDTAQVSDGLGGWHPDQFLGQFGNAPVTLSLSGLPAHTMMTVDIGVMHNYNWENTLHLSGNENFRLKLNDDALLGARTICDGQLGGPPAGANYGVTKVVDGQTVHGGGAIYGYHLSFPHVASQDNLEFLVTGLVGLASWGAWSATVTLDAPQVMLHPAGDDDWSTEALVGNHLLMQFIAERTGDATFPLDVAFSRNGTAAVGDYTISANDNVVHFAAGQSSKTVTVVPTTDNVPEWAENINVELAAGDGKRYYLDETAKQRKLEIVDDDLGISNLPGVIVSNNDDDNQDNITDKTQAGPISGEDDLYPVTVSYPANLKPGASISLNAPYDAVNVWEHADKSGKQFIGGESSSYVWVIGSTDPATSTPIPTTVYVEAINGSTSERTVCLVVGDADSTTTDPPTHPTMNTAANSLVTPVEVGISFRGQDVTDRRAGEVLIGQLMQPVGVVVAPPPPLSPIQYEWVVAGQKFKDYQRKGSGETDQATLIPVSAADLRTQAPSFCWSEGATGGLQLEVSVSITVGASSYFRETTFDVFKPIASLSASHGSVQVINLDPAGDDVLGLLGDANSPHGAYFTANVALPTQFASQTGLWNFLQIGSPSTSVTALLDGQINNLRNRWFGNQGLDAWAYEVGAPENDPYEVSAQDGLLAYETGSGEKQQSDDPHSHFTHNNPVVLDVNRADQFRTYLMFLPPGSGSRWVPLVRLNWDWKGRMTRENAAALFQLVPGSAEVNVGVGEPDSQHPTWNHAINPDPVGQF